MTPKLILTGFMGTGKSAVGALIAQRLGWKFVDTDSEIVARAGRPIADIFAADGEARFRRFEREVIAALVSDPSLCPQCKGPRPAVIATGGGALADDANYRALKRVGVIICLSARADAIEQRVARSAKSRPKLTEGAKSLLTRIKELLGERTPVYAKADVTIDTSDLTIEEAAEKVLAAFGTVGAHRCEPFA
ncbi:MAG: shikimate kinase [Candidatus Binataceae bacterium]